MSILVSNASLAIIITRLERILCPETLTLIREIVRMPVDPEEVYRWVTNGCIGLDPRGTCPGNDYIYNYYYRRWLFRTDIRWTIPIDRRSVDIYTPISEEANDFCGPSCNGSVCFC